MTQPGKQSVGVIIQRIFYRQHKAVGENIAQNQQQIVGACANDDLLRGAGNVPGPIEVIRYRLPQAGIALGDGAQ